MTITVVVVKIMIMKMKMIMIMMVMMMMMMVMTTTTTITMMMMKMKRTNTKAQEGDVKQFMSGLRCRSQIFRRGDSPALQPGGRDSLLHQERKSRWSSDHSHDHF